MGLTPWNSGSSPPIYCLALGQPATHTSQLPAVLVRCSLFGVSSVRGTMLVSITLMLDFCAVNDTTRLMIR